MKDREATGMVLAHHFDIEGSTRGYGAPVNLDGRGRRRLVQYNGFDQPDRELSEADAIALAQDREEEARGEIADPPVEEETTRRVRWTAEEIGLLALGVRDRKTDEQIAAVVHKSVSATAEQVTEVRRWLQRGRRGPGNRGGKGETRARRVTPEQEREARRLYEQGAKSWEIARAVGATVGTVRYVLEHPREGA